MKEFNQEEFEKQKAKLKIKLEDLLQKIGYSLRDHGNGHYFIYDHKKKYTKIMFYSDRLEYDIKGVNVIYSMNLLNPEIEFKWVTNDAVSIGQKNNYVLLMNHDLPYHKKEKVK